MLLSEPVWMKWYYQMLLWIRNRILLVRELLSRDSSFSFLVSVRKVILSDVQPMRINGNIHKNEGSYLHS